jgi:hypothetical protein
MMPKKREPELTLEEQFKRFQEAAKEHEIEERLLKIERAFGESRHQAATTATWLVVGFINGQSSRLNWLGLPM